MRNFLQKVVISIRYWANVRYRKEQINPEIRELLEDFHSKKRIKVNKSLQDEQNQIEMLKKTYEFKCFEHFRKVDYLKTKEDSSEFLKFCKFDLFTDKKRWKRGDIFINHFSVPREYILTTFQKLVLILLGILSFKYGLFYGKKDSQLFDEIKENIVDIRTEDQLMSLLETRKLPLLVLYYYPGDYNAFMMQYAQGRFIEVYGNNYATMAKINCKYNLELCIKKNQYLIFPQWELMQLPVTELDDKKQTIKKYPVTPCKFKRSFEGLEGFLMEEGVIEDRYNPIIFIENAMRKYI